VEKNRIEARRLTPLSLEPRHPDPVAQEEMIQEAVNAAERAAALLPELRFIQFCASFENPFVRSTPGPAENEKGVDALRDMPI
jgi:hypothetical protein